MSDISHTTSEAATGPILESVAGQHHTLRELVYGSLRRAILTGELKDGAVLREREVASSLGVSKTPVREALRKLEREGLTISIPHRGVVVVGLSKVDIREIYELRLALEPFAARLAAERVDDAAAEALRVVMRQMEVAAAAADREELRRLNIAFHAALHRLSGNTRLSRTLAELQEYVHTTRTVEWTVPGGFDRNHELHLAIGEAVLGHRPDEAEASMREHIARALALLVARQTESRGGRE